jgi:alkylation response protein AidB-like acyl-CoA dehydrogenase
VERQLFDVDHDAFRETARAFCDKEIVPHHDAWEEAGIVPRELWKAAGAAGLLGFMMPEEYGGGGARDFRFNAVLIEELTRVRASGVGFTIQPTSTRRTCWTTRPTSRRRAGCRHFARGRRSPRSR